MTSLKNFGSFYLDGRKVVLENLPVKKVWRNEDFPELLINPNGEYAIEQAYVQYFIPSELKSTFPVVLIHGGGHTGSVWENTPDGREGWLHYFLKQGRSVYIIDNVERGRAGWCCLENIWTGEPELRSAHETWDHFRIGFPENYSSRIPYPNQQFPVDYFDKLLDYNVPRWNSHAQQSTAALIKLVQKIGKCFLLAHSQSGEFAQRCFISVPESIAGLVLLEPASFIPLPDQPSLKEKNILFLYGDFLQESTFWHKPYSLGKKLRDSLIQAQANVDWIDLPQQGITGNSHQLMMDKNNLIVAEVIQNWLLQLEKKLTR